jgi:hypothetical protein
MYESLDKRRDEAYFEHVKFENGVFKANWRAPEWDGLTLEQVPPSEFGWLGEPLEEEDSEPGTSAAERLVAKRLARKTLFGIERYIRERHTTFSKIFNNEEVANAENVLPRGTLEVSDFISGLMRIGVLDGNDATVSHEVMVQALHIVDTAFDGHGQVDLRTVMRGVTAARTIRRESIRVRSKRRGDAEQRRPFSASSTLDLRQPLPPAPGHFVNQQTPDPPGKSTRMGVQYQKLPVERVKIEKEPRSIFNFEISFKKFKDQQRSLLEHGGYLRT